MLYSSLENAINTTLLDLRAVQKTNVGMDTLQSFPRKHSQHRHIALLKAALEIRDTKV